MPTVIEKRGGTTIRYTGVPLPKLPVKLRKESQAMLIELGSWWRSNILPQHFEVGAYRRYGGREPNVYERRSPWRGRGLTRSNIGRKKPLTQSGTLRRKALTGPVQFRASGSAGGSKVRIVFRGLPRYVFYRNNNRGQLPNIPRELTITNETDERALAVQARRIWRGRLAKI